ncbi:hypothetical protein FAGAP_968 [Fusarium agapanthi]|uniref:Uncharacterized protein n=1 Tax=Fusarium agapanthi TaxID=1803897 RepID=A0A9P5BIP5_9HYPO|nr:hypothetical protein FAGAP_968 [Fusarium agapanthi]
MTSTVDKIKQEPLEEDALMSDGVGTEEGQENNSSSSNHAGGSRPSQQAVNQVPPNNENQPAQQDVTHTGQSNSEQPGQANLNRAIPSNGNQAGEQPSQINVNGATQNNETRAGQKDIGQAGQMNGNQSPNENPFQPEYLKRKMDKDNSGNNGRGFSPAVEDPIAKKAKTDHAFLFTPPPDKKATPTSTWAQSTSRTSPVPSGYGIDDDDLENDLVGMRACPENMRTLGLVKEGKRPRYMNEYKIKDPSGGGQRSIFRIETLADENFDKNNAMILTGGKYQSEHADKTWQQVSYVLGVAALGSELNYQEFLSKLDPENPKKFQWRQTILIGIRWTDGNISFVTRGWWRNNYGPRNPFDKQTYLERKKEGYYYFYKAREDGQKVVKLRENQNAFEDYRLFKWAFMYEKRYYQAMNPGQNFNIQDRDKSPSPINDEIAKFRAATVEESRKSKIYQSVETLVSDDEEGFDTDSQRSTQSRYKSSGQPRAHRNPFQRVAPNDSPRPRNKNRFNTIRRTQHPLGTTPRSMTAAY